MGLEEEKLEVMECRLVVLVVVAVVLVTQNEGPHFAWVHTSSHFSESVLVSLFFLQEARVARCNFCITISNKKEATYLVLWRCFLHWFFLALRFAKELTRCGNTGFSKRGFSFSGALFRSSSFFWGEEEGRGEQDAIKFNLKGEKYIKKRRGKKISTSQLEPEKNGYHFERDCSQFLPKELFYLSQLFNSKFLHNLPLQKKMEAFD